MFETDQQMRFFRAMTDAWLNAMTASVASVGVANTSMIDAMQPSSRSTRASSPMPSPFSVFTGTPSAMHAQADNPFGAIVEAWVWPFRMLSPSPSNRSQMSVGQQGTAFNFNPFATSPEQFAEAMGQAFSFAQSAVPKGSTGMPWMNIMPWMPQQKSGWAADPEIMKSLAFAFWNWPAIHWPLYTAPVTAAMLSSGVPYAVALPAVRSGLAALDACDAMRLQFVAMMREAKVAPGQTSGGDVIPFPMYRAAQ